MPSAPHVRHGVGEQVEEDRRLARAVRRNEPEQQVPGMGDARIGEHPLDVRLHDADDRAQDHRQASDDRQHGDPLGLQRLEGREEDAHEGRERGGLHCRRHEGGDDRGRPLVGIGRPHVERHGGYLEREANRQQAHRQQGERGGLTGAQARERFADLVDAGGTGERESERDAVEKKRAREGTEQEIFEGGLRAPRTVAADPREDVNGEREDFQSEEDHEQVSRGRHHHHSADREERQRIVLAGRDLLTLHDAVGHQHRQHADEAQNQVDEEREIVRTNHAHALRIGVPQNDGRHRGSRKADEAEAGNRHPLTRLAEGLRQHGGNRRQGDDGERNQCGVFSHYSELADRGCGFGLDVAIREFRAAGGRAVGDSASSARCRDPGRRA